MSSELFSINIHTCELFNSGDLSLACAHIYVAHGYTYSTHTVAHGCLCDFGSHFLQEEIIMLRS